MEKWNRVHHVIKGLLATRVNPETGKEKLVDETIRETPLGKAEGIFSVLGRQRGTGGHYANYTYTLPCIRCCWQNCIPAC